jgi:hypothetical protein
LIKFDLGGHNLGTVILSMELWNINPLLKSSQKNEADRSIIGSFFDTVISPLFQD